MALPLQVQEADLVSGDVQLHCPHCYSILNIHLQRYRQPAHIILGLGSSLTLSQSKLFDILYSHIGECVSQEVLANALWGKNCIGDWYDWRHNLRVQITRLRGRLLLQGWNLRTVPTRGYILTKD